LSEQLRLFFAVPVAAQLTESLTQIQQELRAAGAKVSWTRPENLHFTLKFLGDTPEDQVTELNEVAARVAEDIAAHQIEIGGVGGFPNRSRPRVVWVGCTAGSEQFAQLGEKLDQYLSEAGLAEPDKRKFTPHLTIGRVRSRHRLEDLADSMQQLSQCEIGPMQVNHFVLMRSQLHPDGAIHTALARFELR